MNFFKSAWKSVSKGFSAVEDLVKGDLEGAENAFHESVRYSNIALGLGDTDKINYTVAGLALIGGGALGYSMGGASAVGAGIGGGEAGVSALTPSGLGYTSETAGLINLAGAESVAVPLSFAPEVASLGATQYAIAQPTSKLMSALKTTQDVAGGASALASVASMFMDVAQPYLDQQGQEVSFATEPQTASQPSVLMLPSSSGQVYAGKEDFSPILIGILALGGIILLMNRK